MDLWDGWASTAASTFGAALIAIFVMRWTLRHDDKRVAEDRETAERHIREERELAEQRARSQRGVDAGDSLCAALQIMYERAVAGDREALTPAHQQAVIAWIKLRSAVASHGGPDFCRSIDRIERSIFEYSTWIAKINAGVTSNPSPGFPHTPNVIDAIVRWTQASIDDDETRRSQEDFLVKMQEAAENAVVHVRLS